MREIQVMVKNEKKSIQEEKDLLRKEFQNFEEKCEN
jgi:hypothetical protein